MPVGGKWDAKKGQKPQPHRDARKGQKLEGWSYAFLLDVLSLFVQQFVYFPFVVLGAVTLSPFSFPHFIFLCLGARVAMIS